MNVCYLELTRFRRDWYGADGARIGSLPNPSEEKSITITNTQQQQQNPIIESPPPYFGSSRFGPRFFIRFIFVVKRCLFLCCFVLNPRLTRQLFLACVSACSCSPSRTCSSAVMVVPATSHISKVLTATSISAVVTKYLRGNTHLHLTSGAAFDDELADANGLCMLQIARIHLPRCG